MTCPMPPMAMNQRITIGKLSFDALTLEESARQIVALTEAAGPMALIATPNADHVVRAEEDPSFAAIVGQAALVTADGMPVVWASRLLGSPLPERVTGADLLPKVCQLAAQAGKSIFLMGGLPGEAELAASRLQRDYPGLVVAGTHSPPFGFEKSPEESARLIDLVNASGAAILFLGVGSPKQEKWLAEHRTALRCQVGIGVGIAIAFCAGTMPRAPRWMQKSGLEWLYRLSREPRRLAGRYLTDLRILAIVARSLAQKS